MKVFVALFLCLPACGEVNVTDPEVNVDAGSTAPKPAKEVAAATQVADPAKESQAVSATKTPAPTVTTTTTEKKEKTTTVTKTVVVAPTEDEEKGKVAKGMTKAEVLEVFGEPSTIEESLMSYPGVVWAYYEKEGEEVLCIDEWQYYDDECFVHFDENGEVSAIENIKGSHVDLGSF